MSFNSCIINLFAKNTLLFRNYLPRNVYLCKNISVSTVDFAGHAKWQNIKHIKASKDLQKSQLFNRLVLKIRTAVQKQGGADPHLNREFAEVIELCRKSNMPNSTIEKAVKRGLEKKIISLKMEIICPENSFLIIDAEVDNRNYFRKQLLQILKKKVGFGFADEGRAMALFSEKGVVRVKNKNENEEFDLSKAEDIAIEAEAEEVQIFDEDPTILMFIGDQHSHTKVKGHIERNYSDLFVIIENGIELFPYTRVEVSEKSFQIILDAINEIGELEGVNRVYNNIK